MNISTKTALLFLAVICPVYCFAQNEATGLHFKAEVLSVINLVLLVMALVSIKQFFWPGELNYSPFHVINILSVLTFYSIGLYFLVANRHEYLGYENCTPGMCMIKFFFSPDIDSLKQWVVIFGLVINVLYIVRKSRSII